MASQEHNNRTYKLQLLMLLRMVLGRAICSPVRRPARVACRIGGPSAARRGKRDPQRIVDGHEEQGGGKGHSVNGATSGAGRSSRRKTASGARPALQ
jgi:hypothetical protein